MPAKLYSKSFKLGFSSMWTKNFQMNKQGFEETEEPEIKLPTFVGSWGKQGSSRKISTSASLITPKPLTVWITTNCKKILNKWEYQITLPVSWETSMWVNWQVRIGGGMTDWFKTGKGVCQGCILSPYLFNLYAEYIMQNAGLNESQAGIKIVGRNINLRYADDTTLTAESKEELKILLMKVKEETWEAGFTLNIQKTKIMASGPITSWQIDGENVGTVTDFIFLGSQITVDGDCSHEIKRRLLLGRKAMINLDSILKNRDRIYFGGWWWLQMVTAAMKLKDTCSLEEKLWPTQISY